MYALVDCNNFYVSCERVFVPQWQGRPVVVLSNNDGCLISRSDEAKALGFKMGEPYHLVRPLLELSQVKVFSSNYARYGDMSRRVVRVLSEFAAGVEVYSIDEAFLDFRGMHWLAPNLQRYGEQLRARLWRELHGQPCLEWNPAAGEDDEQPTPGTGRHSIMHTHSFARPQHELAALSEAVATFAARAGEKLRRHEQAAYLVTVVLGTDRYAPGTEPATRTAVVHLPIATADTPLLTQAALRGLRQLHRPGVAYHRAGVLLSGLEKAGQGQLDLFAPVIQPVPTRLQLMLALDRLNSRFGRHMVRLAAAAGPNPAWAGRQAYRSPAYTTDWEDLWELK